MYLGKTGTESFFLKSGKKWLCRKPVRDRIG